MKSETDEERRWRVEKEMVAGESLDSLKASVDAFFGTQSRGQVVDEAYRRRMHAALDTLLERLRQRRSCAGDRQRGRR
jgi:hypothetical protein